LIFDRSAPSCRATDRIRHFGSHHQTNIAPTIRMTAVMPVLIICQSTSMPMPPLADLGRAGGVVSTYPGAACSIYRFAKRFKSDICQIGSNVSGTDLTSLGSIWIFLSPFRGHCEPLIELS
jgi:hypothetical protein